jgi:fermentation-respiration switch protein FrsA (DUF1100 family)
MIASAIEPRIKGLLLVSSSGFRFTPQADPLLAEYLSSISGDTYISRLSPRPLLMLHDESDTVVPYSHAQGTFGKAGQPKEILTINESGHSYVPAMKEILQEGLEGW